MKTAGNAAGLIVVGQVNKLSFIQNIQKPAIKGLVTIFIGRVGLPFLAKLAGQKGKKGTSDLINGAEEAIATYGVAQVGGSFAATANLFPKISGYEQNPVAGIGLTNAEDNMNGYEQNPISGPDDMAGLEDNGMNGIGADEIVN